MNALGEHLRRYLALRRAVGFQGGDLERGLFGFVDYLAAAGQVTLTIPAALAWAKQTSTTDLAVARRLMWVRGFARYLQAFDPAAEVPPKSVAPAATIRPAPHIYTAAEVAALIEAAEGLNPTLWGQTMATLVGLLAATGIRPGEAYRLGRGDVDLVEGRLRLIDSKFGRSREIPLHASTVAALDDYRRDRDRVFSPAAHGGFFVTARGGPLRTAAVSGAFRELRHRAAIPDRRRPARLGDLRHSFAVTTLLEWHRDGVDVAVAMAKLSAYLGHLNPACTYWYLEATPELMAVVAGRLEAPR